MRSRFRTAFALRVLGFSAVSALLFCWCPSAQSKSDKKPRTWGANAEVSDYRLANGLEIYLEQIPNAKAMGLFLFVKTGYTTDPAGRTGLAHLTEHMVMTASTPLRPEVWDYQRWNKERKGANAMTRPTFTVYYSIGTREQLSVDARRWGEVLAGKADLNQTLLEQERVAMLKEVVHMAARVPGGALMWLARRVVLTGTPAGRQGIGVPDEIAKIRAVDVQRFYKAHYRPNNALLVCVGRVDPRVDRPFYQGVFGGLARREGPAAVRTARPVAVPPSTRVHPSLGAVHGTFVFPAPAVASAEFPAFCIAALWVCYQARRKFAFRGQEAAAMFHPGLYPFAEDPSLVFLNRRGRATDDVAAVRQEIETWLEGLSERRLPDRALRGPKLEVENLLDPLPRSAFRARLVASHANMLYRVGMVRGASRLLGFPKDLAARAARVTGEEVKALVSTSFRPKEGTFLALVPSARKEKKPKSKKQ